MAFNHLKSHFENNQLGHKTQMGNKNLEMMHHSSDE
jgi:hypothetical protein